LGERTSAHSIVDKKTPSKQEGRIRERSGGKKELCETKERMKKTRQRF
jgi:hypothetical protein